MKSKNSKKIVKKTIKNKKKYTRKYTIKYSKYSKSTKNIKIKTQFGGTIDQEDINLWSGFNSIVNSYINYKIFVNDGWRKDECNFKMDSESNFKEFDFKSKDGTLLKKLSDEREEKSKKFVAKESQPFLSIINILMEKCKDSKDATDNCIVTPDSSGDKLRCHLKTNFNIFSEGARLKIPINNGEQFTLVKIIYHNDGKQFGGDIDGYIKTLYLLDILNQEDKTGFLKELKSNELRFSPESYVKRQIDKYIKNGSYFCYVSESKKKLVVNFPMYTEPYLYFFGRYHSDTELTTEPIIDGIKVHNGYNDLVRLHIDSLSAFISKILAENPGIEYILFTGHSMGASIIQLTLFYLLEILKNKELIAKLKNIKLFTTGAPRVGNFRWYEWWNNLSITEQIFNFYNINDTYATTPGVRNTILYNSDDIDDFYPIKPFLFDYNPAKSKFYVLHDKKKEKNFLYRHFDYVNFENTSQYKKAPARHHDLQEYISVFQNLES